jgi:glyoxylase I family protein
VIEDEIRELELSLITQPGRSSAEHLREVVSEDFREFGTSGRTYGKGEVIAELLSKPSPAASSGPALVDLRVVELAPGVALATYRTRLSLRSSIWRREAGAWRLYFHQGTPAPPRDDTA